MKLRLQYHISTETPVLSYNPSPLHHPHHSTRSPFLPITPVRNTHSSSLTLLTLSLVSFSICMFSNGLLFSAWNARRSLSVTGVWSFCRNSTCTSDHLGLEGSDDGSWYGAEGSWAETEGVSIRGKGRKGNERKGVGSESEDGNGRQRGRTIGCMLSHYLHDPHDRRDFARRVVEERQVAFPHRAEVVARYVD